ncbi:hypothetical protein GCM10018780_18420 [Streptomyces lanatus]|nr:hypothetical protein GCM10018780_18420 [Streptomyces lanatus]
MNGPNGGLTSRPRMSARNRADSFLSRAATMVWLSWTVIGAASSCARFGLAPSLFTLGAAAAWHIGRREGAALLLRYSAFGPG